MQVFLFSVFGEIYRRRAHHLRRAVKGVDVLQADIQPLFPENGNIRRHPLKQK